MSFKHLSLFKGSSSIKSYEIDKPITLLIVVGIVFVLIFALLGPVFLELENDDFPLIKSNPITRTRGILSYEALLSGFQSGVFALILLFEFLRGHIGEKRFAVRSIETGFSSHIDLVSLTTARLGRRLCSLSQRGIEHESTLHTFVA